MRHSVYKQKWLVINKVTLGQELKNQSPVRTRVKSDLTFTY